MIKNPITKDERKQLLAKLSRDAFWGLVFIIVFLVIGLSLQFDHLDNFFPFVIFKYFCIGVWLYFTCKLLWRLMRFIGYILLGTAIKITAEFVVTKKEVMTTSNDNFSDAWHYYIFIHSKEANKNFCLEVGLDDYEKIQVPDILTLTFFSKINHLMEVFHKNSKLEKISIFK